MLFCTIHSDEKLTLETSVLKYIINSDSKKNSVAYELILSRTQILPFNCDGNVSYNRLAVKGVGTRLSTSKPSLPVRRPETNRGEVCRVIWHHLPISS